MLDPESLQLLELLALARLGLANDTALLDPAPPDPPQPPASAAGHNSVGLGGGSLASKIMDTVFVLTSGGPGTATETSSFYIYIKGLREFQMGYAATLSFTYLVIMIISLTIIAKVLTKLMIKE